MDELELYNQKILNLASQSTKEGKIRQEFQYYHTKTSPLCGSRLSCGFDFYQGKFPNSQFITQSCALGSASAYLFSQILPDANLNEIIDANTQIAQMLSNETPLTTEKFAQFAIFKPCAPHRSRHGAILLPFTTIIEAIKIQKIL